MCRWILWIWPSYAAAVSLEYLVWEYFWPHSEKQNGRQSRFPTFFFIFPYPLCYSHVVFSVIKGCLRKEFLKMCVYVCVHWLGSSVTNTNRLSNFHYSFISFGGSLWAILVALLWLVVSVLEPLPSSAFISFLQKCFYITYYYIWGLFLLW